MPPLIKISIILSRAEESDPFSLTRFLKVVISGINAVENFDFLALAQFLFPLIALISPLWASNLNG